MTDNKQLIEETAKAIMEASHGEGEWEFREPLEEELYLRRARAALAVFEKAHTPTDDEREALAQWLHMRFAWPNSPSERTPWLDLPKHLKEGWRDLAGDAPTGFRRSEVPEPTVEEWNARIESERNKAFMKGYTPQHDDEHGAQHLLAWAIDYARRGKAEASSGLIRSAIYVLARLAEEPEPQGEPSEHEVYAFRRALGNAGHSIPSREDALAILRAARDANPPA